MLFLPLLLSACASPIKTQKTQVIVLLPPSGLLVPCSKPPIQGTWPDVISQDIPKLKRALTQCDQQIQDYLQWRALHENNKENTQ